MRKLLTAIIMLMFIMACVSQVPWRKATVSSFELLGIGITAAKESTTVLYNSKVIGDSELSRAKLYYSDAVKIYTQMGETLKLADEAKTAVDRERIMEEYNALLQKFKSLSLSILQIVNDAKNRR